MKTKEYFDYRTIDDSISDTRKIISLGLVNNGIRWTIDEYVLDANPFTRDAIAGVDDPTLEMPKGLKKYVLDTTVSAVVGTVLFAPFEILRFGSALAYAMRKQTIIINSVGGLSRAYGIWRNAWMHNFGLSHDTGDFKRWFHEGSCGAALFTPAYVALQSFNGMDPEKLIEGVAFSLFVSYGVNWAYGLARDKWFTFFGEKGSLEQEQEELGPIEKVLVKDVKNIFKDFYKLGINNYKKLLPSKRM